MDEIDRTPHGIAMLILRDVCGMEDALVPKSGQGGVQLGQIISVNEEIDVHRQPRCAERS